MILPTLPKLIWHHTDTHISKTKSPFSPECFQLSDIRQKGWWPFSAAPGAHYMAGFSGLGRPGCAESTKPFQKHGRSRQSHHRLGAVIYFVRNAGLSLRLVNRSSGFQRLALGEQNTNAWSEPSMSFKGTGLLLTHWVLCNFCMFT